MMQHRLLILYSGLIIAVLSYAQNPEIIEPII